MNEPLKHFKTETKLGKISLTLILEKDTERLSITKIKESLVK